MTSATAAAAAPASIHQLKVTLRGIRPPIWRRLLVPSTATLARLHDILQVAMGWHDSHLHEFEIGETIYGDPDMIEDWAVQNERAARLTRVAPRPKDRLRYQYDFGDSWEHEILVEAVAAPRPGVRYPTCVAGKRACPPEDCGGVWGYAELLEAIRDPLHPEHASIMSWLGGPFDPEVIDLAAINQRLAGLG